MMQLNDFDKVDMTLTTDKSLPVYSHSILNALSTCPTYGMVTYIANKVMKNVDRAMALEAGSASHDAFAAARLWQLADVQGLTWHAQYHGVRLFGEDRYSSMKQAMREAGTDKRNAMLRFCLEAFYTSGFYDDPRDKRRTFTNIEESLIAYLDRFDFKKDVWIEDRNRPEQLVGVEIPFDVTVSYSHEDRTDVQVRVIGIADGLHWNRGNLVLDENKTAARLNEAWVQSFQTSHQITCYMMALSTMLGVHIDRAVVHGMAIPLPRSYDSGGLINETVRRSSSQFGDMLQWLLYVHQLVEMFRETPIDAPKFTGSCNKYFRACPLIPLCGSDKEDRELIFDEMVTREPSPSEKAMEGDE